MGFRESLDDPKSNHKALICSFISTCSERIKMPSSKSHARQNKAPLEGFYPQKELLMT